MMKNENNSVCCQIFQYWLQDPYPMFFYDASNRRSLVTAPQRLLKKVKSWPSYQLFFCPVCGAQFPYDLSTTRNEILKKEYGINDPYDPLIHKLIPQEFLTSAWWQKRGL